MTRITSADQVLLLLRNHLQRADRLKRSSSSRSTRPAGKTPLERVHDIAATQDSAEEDVRRALIAGLLTEEFGAGLANDARFREMVNSIVDTISADEACSELFGKALEQLKRG